MNAAALRFEHRLNWDLMGLAGLLVSVSFFFISTVAVRDYTLGSFIKKKKKKITLQLYVHRRVR